MITPKKVLIGSSLAILGLIIAFSDPGRLLSKWQAQREVSHGKELATLYCSTCHLEPLPDILPKRSWEMVLGYMGYMMGIENIDYLSHHPEFAQENVKSKLTFLTRENMVPAAPILSDSDWETLRHYYVESATEVPIPQASKPTLSWELPQFDIVQSNYRSDPTITTLVHVKEDTNQVYIGDAAANSLAILGADGQLISPPLKFGPAIAPVDIEFTADSAFLASIGDLFSVTASFEKVATISRLPLVDQSVTSTSISVAINDIYRMADMDTDDFNGDGVLDFVVCGFGGQQGNLAWFESQPDGSYLEHVLIGRPGAVKAVIHDFNGDQHPDIAVLLSHAQEGFYILTNNGENEFESTTIFETHPSYGHTYFELQDFNQDGQMDFLVVNGDNVDSDPYNTLKNFQGIRIYLNQGDLQFEEAYFYPMYGAFGARAADFDNDGDLDIAAISFSPDFAIEQRESFVYLENNGRLEFTAHSTPELNSGRWMTIDAGDIDGDADVDIVLGGANVPTGMFAFMDTYRALAESAPSILILDNNSIKN
ncbi:MAG TPA: hypothetical protein DCY55_04460 [Gammaproteobacteria bacterium]|nr:VCBS repeat-containing protein [Pseudomonadota bacterium]HAY45517.1 hypothetical protein [Gammaproteobacteria bacterium]